MRELDELKSTWNGKQLAYSKAALSDIFEVKTKRTVRAINRTMLLDYTLMLIAAAGLIALTFFLGLKSRYIVALEILTVTSLMIIHYGIKYRVINSVNLQHNDVKHSISKLSNRLNAYLLAYRVVIPVFIGAVYLKIQWNLLQIKGVEWQEELLAIGLAVPIMVLTYFLVQWISKRMYGRAIEQLKQLKEQWDGLV